MIDKAARAASSPRSILAAAAACRRFDESLGDLDLRSAEVADQLSEAFDKTARNGGTVLLAGRPGFGRRFLVTAAASLRSAHDPTVLVGIDLANFDPGNGGSHWTALLAALPSMSEKVAEPDPVAGGRAADKERVEVALRSLASGRQVLLHLRNATDFPLPILADLAAVIAVIPGLSLVVSCMPWQFNGLSASFPGEVAGTIHLNALAREELESYADRAGHPYRVTPDIHEMLWELSRGIPVLAARALRGWKTGGLLPVATQQAFRIEDRVSAQLERFLGLAGLCGEYVPADLVLAYLGISDEATDEVLDRIDADLLAEGDMIFHDLQYSHAAFPSHLIYRFADPGIAALASSLSSSSSGILNEGPAFLAFLEEKMTRTRGAARVLLSVASAIEAVDARSRHLREIDWWVGESDATALTQFLASGMRRREIAAETIWVMCQEKVRFWPGFRRFAMLEAYAQQPDGIPKDRQGEFLWNRAALLHELGRNQEAHDDAVQGLALLERDSGPSDPRVVSCRGLVGAILHELGDYSGAHRELAAALSAASELGREGVDLQNAVLNLLAKTLRALGDLGSMRRRLEEGVASASMPGSDPRKTSFFLKHLAKVLRDTGELGEAAKALEEVIRLDRFVVGEGSLELTVPLRHLADVRMEMGDKRAARNALADSLRIQEAAGVAGNEVAVLRSVLIEVLIDLGEDGAARCELEAALADLGYEDKSGSARRSRESVLLRRLGELAYRQRDFVMARGFLERALRVEEALPGSEPSQATILKYLGDVFLALHDDNAALTCLRRALEIEEGLFGADDPRTAPNRDFLAALLERLGRFEEAAGLRSQAAQ